MSRDSRSKTTDTDGGEEGCSPVTYICCISSTFSLLNLSSGAPWPKSGLEILDAFYNQHPVTLVVPLSGPSLPHVDTEDILNATFSSDIRQYKHLLLAPVVGPTWEWRGGP